MRYSRYLFFFVFFGFLSRLAASCPFPDSLIDQSSTDQYLIQSVDNGELLDEHCFSILLQIVQIKRKETADNMRALLSRINEGKGVGNEVLFSAYRNQSVYKNTKLWDTIVLFWIRKNRSSHEAFIKLVNDGFPAQADTLFTIFDAENALDVYDLARWAEVKSVTGDYYKLPDIFYRYIHEEPRLQLIALNEFSGILAEMSSEVADSVLELFSKHCDPSSFKNVKDYKQVLEWILDSWGQLGSYSRQIKYVNETFFGDKRGEVLLQIAQGYYKRRNHTSAASIARAAFEVASPKIKDSCAQIAYQSWVALNEIDSAMVWIGKTTLVSLGSRVAGAVLYQNSGNFEMSSRLIDSLPNSLIRDTLQIRQYIFKRELKNADDFLSESKSLANSVTLHTIWKLRLLLFNNSMNEFQKLVDSLRIMPEWSSSTELLSYRYWIQKLNQQQEMLAVWATIEYNNYIGKPLDSGVGLCSGLISGEQHTALILRAAKEIVKQSPSDAVDFFSMCNDTSTAPEFIYYKAEALYLCGKFSQARRMLESMILEHPQDIHVGKARLLLSQEKLKED